MYKRNKGRIKKAENMDKNIKKMKEGKLEEKNSASYNKKKRNKIRQKRNK